MDANLQLMFHWIPLLIGLHLMGPWGAGLAEKMSKRWPSMLTERGRKLGGLILVLFSGLTVSTHTFWIHNKLFELGGGSFCASGTLFDCDSVITSKYGVDPVFGLPWGLVGMMAFTILLWCAISIAKEPIAPWVSRQLTIGRMVAGGGLFVIALLVFYEIKLETLCQYCTTAHIANIIALFGFMSLSKLHDDGRRWAPDQLQEMGKDTSATKRREKRSGGYVAPKILEEE